MAVYRQDSYKKTTQATPSLYILLHGIDVPRILIAKLTEQFQVKKDVGMGLLVESFYNMSCLYTAISTPSFCGFWHCHPYIPLHFWRMFFILTNTHRVN